MQAAAVRGNPSNGKTQLLPPRRLGALCCQKRELASLSHGNRFQDPQTPPGYGGGNGGRLGRPGARSTANLQASVSGVVPYAWAVVPSAEATGCPRDFSVATLPQLPPPCEPQSLQSSNPSQTGKDVHPTARSSRASVPVRSPLRARLEDAHLVLTLRPASDGVGGRCSAQLGGG